MLTMAMIGKIRRMYFRDHLSFSEIASGSGLEAVLVAVELALESGVASQQHILNMLSRLKPGPVTDPVYTKLHIQQPPIVDTQRYDQLHRAGSVEEAVHA